MPIMGLMGMLSRLSNLDFCTLFCFVNLHAIILTSPISKVYEGWDYTLNLYKSRNSLAAWVALQLRYAICRSVLHVLKQPLLYGHPQCGREP